MGHCGCDTLVVPELEIKNELVCGDPKSPSIPCSSHSYLGLLFAKTLKIISGGSEPKSDSHIFTALTYELHEPDS